MTIGNMFKQLKKYKGLLGINARNLRYIRPYNKKEAIKALNSYNFDVVVTDISTSLFDGLEICKMAYKELPVVAVSNQYDHERLSDACDCFIEKLEIKERLFKAAMKAIERRSIGLAIAA